MRLPPEHHPFPAQPVLPRELRQIDAALWDLAASEPLPDGLTDRVYTASVKALPSRLRYRGRTVAMPQMRARVRRPIWGQLALAASIGLSFVIAAWLLTMPSGVSDRGALIAERADSTEGLTLAQRSNDLLSPEAEWLLLDSGFNGRASHLVETRDLTFAELRSESQRLFDELEL